MDPHDDIELLLSGGVPDRDASSLFGVAPPAPAPLPVAVPAPAPVIAPVGAAAVGATAAASGGDAAGSAEGGGARKRTLPDDRKAREKKRILRNRELARVSNERRKGRIKAMENELEDTRKTVSSLEESIAKLEEENADLRILLESKTTVLRQ